MPPDPFTIFLDENHCNNKAILALLDEVGVPVERHLQHFPPGTRDEVWLQVVGKNGWVLLTTDKRIRYRAAEKMAVEMHSVRMFYFSKNMMSGAEMAAALRKALPRIRRLYELQLPPFCAAITRSGEVDLRETFRP